MASDQTAIALIYWGRRGSGAQVRQIGDALGRDARFLVYRSLSTGSEFPADETERDLPFQTFSGPLTFTIRSLGLDAAISRLVARMKAAGIKAAITYMPHVWGVAFQRAAQKAGIRTLLIVHDADPHPGERRPPFDRLVRTESRAADRVVTLSAHVADTLLARGDVEAADLVRLFHPILAFAASESPAARPGRPFRLLFFGRILPYKGVSLLLEAFAEARMAGVDCTLRIVGRGRIAAPPGLSSLPGLTIEERWVPNSEIGDLLANADAVVLPYLEASQSGVAAAAYGAGLPVIATPVGGLMEQVIDGVTGTVATAVTAPAVAAAIRRLVATEGLYDSCRAGIADYVDRHSMQHFAEQLGDAALDAIARPRRSR